VSTFEQKVVFLHIPKTAGTSFHLLLTQYFGEQETCPIRNRQLDQVGDSLLSSYRLFSGHYFFNQIERIPAPRKLVTILREPRNRLISLYNFHRSFRWDRISSIEELGYDSPRYAKELSFAEYLRCTEYSVRMNTDNAITRYLVGLNFVDSNGQWTISEDSALNIALTHLQIFDGIGLVEKIHQTLRMFEAILGFSFPDQMPVHNDFASLSPTGGFENVEGAVIDDDAENELDRSTRIDQQVYTWAVKKFRVPGWMTSNITLLPSSFV
jgi:Sulfotransferase family